MLSLANFTLQNRRNAILLALLFAMVPLMGWVADIIMALVTLRKGAKEGAIILLWIMLPSLLLALKGSNFFLLYNGFAGSVITYVFALVLRYKGDWSSVLQVAVFIGLVEIIGLHLILPNLDADWSRELIKYFSLIAQKVALQASQNDMTAIAALLSKVITGFQLTFLFVYDLIILGLARYLQACLFNPTGFRPELYNIRANPALTLVFAVTVVASLMANNIAVDCLFLVIMPFIVAGISLVHYLSSYFKIAGFWFLGFYGLLILFFPYGALALTLLALVDIGFNFRQRYKLQ